MTGDSGTEKSHIQQCAGCGDDLDLQVDTHYRVGEEERPVKSLEKAEEELDVDDFFSPAWLVCPGCMGGVLEDV